MAFICSICGEEGTQICARCTKDVCSNHLCEKCLKCSDCCECEVVLREPAPALQVARHAADAQPQTEAPPVARHAAEAQSGPEAPAEAPQLHTSETPPENS